MRTDHGFVACDVKAHAWSMTRPSISFATSSKLSVTRSRWRKSSRAIRKRIVFEDPCSLNRRLRPAAWIRSEEHTSELQSLMRRSYAVFCLEKKRKRTRHKYSN